MQYRKFGPLDWQTSALGFGCMRLPTLGEYAKIDEPEAIMMIRKAIDGGVNYVDTAYGYHGGNSEVVVGKALADGYRSKVKVATKMPMWHVKEVSDFDRLLSEQLSRLGDEHIDLYLLHALNRDTWELAKRLDFAEWARKAIADGRIGCLGFSFHAEYDVFEDIIHGYDEWAFCQIQYNYMNENHQAGTKGLELAASKGLAVVVMEPLLGGNLVNPPEPIERLWNESDRDWSAAEWALQWLWNRDEVSVVLSGMSTMEQVEQNLESADRSRVGVLTERDLETVETVRFTYEKIRPIPCTSCRYCMPCEYGVDIPRNLALYNTAYTYNRFAEERRSYAGMDAAIRADQCTACKECESKCPQNIRISEWMSCIREELGAPAK
jgi:uncharacterized protein